MLQIIRILLTLASVPYFRYFADVKDCKLIDPLAPVNFCKKKKNANFLQPLNGIEISYLHIITRHFFGEFVILNI